ncbi:GatB/YqeY domain-containing protein [Tessaracoccus sp. OS52]|uniref:GatB/YqeY domain-containing protein n=1 Tax=Tessaracoccus sp. OS52 TaxID=2886691 RepID=UPI001D12338A|nr:GatB/YqeY domain-containing protein [Tessaracoccus sp. OS52]MCC2592773.1 GatB/YqeY domain-containing protein [Tessaracoccus sp. OS52]
MGASKERLRTDLAAALRAKDELAKTNIRALLAAIGHEEVAGDVARELSDEEELAVITREQRKRRDSAQTYADAGRKDLADNETAEAEFIARYLPQPLTDAELQALVDEEVQALRDGGDSPTMKQMGSIVKAVNVRAAGRADGATVARLVRAALGA